MRPVLMRVNEITAHHAYNALNMSAEIASTAMTKLQTGVDRNR
jgi:hypothetical protein